MIKFLLSLILFTQVIVASDLTFQVYIFDSSTNDLLNSESVVDIQAAFIDLNETEYLEDSFDQIIENGIVHINFDIDFSDTSSLFVFDQPGLSLRVWVDGDIVDVPIYSGFISVYSKMADRVPQILDTNLLYLDYDEASIGIGTGATNDSIITSTELLPDGTTITSHALIVKGTLKADKFIGDGYYINNVQGLGLNDDHSLERNYSRTMPSKKSLGL